MTLFYRIDSMNFIISYYVSVILASVAASEDTVSINKPIMRSPKPWHFSTDYVRCFCNLPSCVTTGYMCKSSIGGCFSDVLDQSTSVYRGRHGCLELLTEKDQRAKCQTRGGINERTIIRRKENSKSLFLCCHHDMCNHIENPQTKNLINNTLLGDVSSETDSRYQQQEEAYLYSNSDVWFRAATIAVPICGAVILFVLIALAVKILKSEHQDSAMHKLGPTMYIHQVPPQCKNSKDHFERTYENLIRKECVPTHHHHHNVFYTSQSDIQRQAQLPLLMHNELTASVNVEKNETNAMLNLRNCDVSPGKSIILEIEKEPPKCLEVNIVNSAKDSKFADEKSFLS